MWKYCAKSVGLRRKIRVAYGVSPPIYCSICGTCCVDAIDHDHSSSASYTAKVHGGKRSRQGVCNFLFIYMFLMAGCILDIPSLQLETLGEGGGVDFVEPLDLSSTNSCRTYCKPSEARKKKERWWDMRGPYQVWRALRLRLG